MSMDVPSPQPNLCLVPPGSTLHREALHSCLWMFHPQSTLLPNSCPWATAWAKGCTHWSCGQTSGGVGPRERFAQASEIQSGPFGWGVLGSWIPECGLEGEDHGLAVGMTLWHPRPRGGACPDVALGTVAGSKDSADLTTLHPIPQSKNGAQHSYWWVIPLGSASPHKPSLFKCNSLLLFLPSYPCREGRTPIPSTTWSKTQAPFSSGVEDGSGGDGRWGA